MGSEPTVPRDPSEVVTEAGSPPLPPVPSPLGRKLLLFEFVVLVEYWTAPLFLDLTNYAGSWSEAGVLLFVLLVATLALFVVGPVLRHLRPALRVGHDRWIFHGIWAGSLLIGLLATSVVQFVGASGGGSVLLGRTVVYTSFGAWPSLTVLLPGAGVFLTLNVEVPTSLALLAFLSATAVLLGPVRQARACALGAPRKGLWPSRLASVAIWSPFGFITGCSACTPAYLALLALVAPGAAASGYSAIPLVPWIGLAGLLYLGSLALALHLLGRATRVPSEPEASSNEALRREAAPGG
jgi:hypothetical protein